MICILLCSVLVSIAPHSIFVSQHCYKQHLTFNSIVLILVVYRTISLPTSSSCDLTCLPLYDSSQLNLFPSPEIFMVSAVSQASPHGCPLVLQYHRWRLKLSSLSSQTNALCLSLPVTRAETCLAMPWFNLLPPNVSLLPGDLQGLLPTASNTQLGRAS